MYQVPDEQLSEGRVVRCVRCTTDWLPVVAVPAAGEGDVAVEPAAEPIVKPVVEPMAEPMAELARDVQPAPEVPVRRMALDEDMVGMASPGAIAEASPQTAAVPRAGRAPWLAIAWVVSVLAVGGGVAALGVWREAVMAAWPPSVRAYAAIGLAGSAPR